MIRNPFLRALFAVGVAAWALLLVAAVAGAGIWATKLLGEKFLWLSLAGWLAWVAIGTYRSMGEP